MPSRQQVTPAEIEAVIGVIKRHRKKGVPVSKERATRNGYGRRVIRKHAGTLKVTESKMRTAELLARPGKGYNEKQLARLFRRLRTHRPVFGIAHVSVLVTVPWDQERDDLEYRCIKQNMSISELKIEIRRQFGARRRNGRRQAIVAERGHLLVQLDAMATTWLRWCEAAGKVVKDGRPTNALKRLPSNVQKQVADVRRVMEQLSVTVSKELNVFSAKLRKDQRERNR